MVIETRVAENQVCRRIRSERICRILVTGILVTSLLPLGVTVRVLTTECTTELDRNKLAVSPACSTEKSLGTNTKWKDD